MNKKILKISKPLRPFKSPAGIVSGPCYRVYEGGAYRKMTEEEIKESFKPNEVIVIKASDCEKLRTTSEFNKNIKEFCSGNLGEPWFNKEEDN